jgi:outer membrane protein OmpA-like peptidoglycan-associated protein/tetratricopeptide (TPR) repeat protein
MKVRLTLFSLLLLFTFHSGMSQGVPKAAKCAFNKGYRQFLHFDYLRALPNLKEAANLDPAHPKYQFILGRCLFESWQERASLAAFQRAYQLDAGADPHLNYYLARALHVNGEYDKAMSHYQLDLNNYSSDSKDYLDTELRIKQCESAMRMQKESYKNYQVKNMGQYVNSCWPEYAATFADNFNYMLYTTRRPSKHSDPTGTKYLPEDVSEEVYSAHYEDGIWAQAQRFRKPIHVFSHDASVALSEDGQTMVYYNDRNYGDIYVSHQEEGKWSKRESIGSTINTEKYHEPSVFISLDNANLFFVSNKPDGQGGLDIYVSGKDASNQWGEGTNLGSKINSAYDEDSPFLSDNGKMLYFSSNGPNSMGGFDIFKCEKQPDGSWGNPENLGPGINSPGDDIFFYPRRDGQGFYFSSDRPGGMGDMDIYSGQLGDIDAPGAPLTQVEGSVVNKSDNEPMNAQVTLIDPVSGETVKVESTSAADPKFNFTFPKGVKEFDISVKVDAPASSMNGDFIGGTVKDAQTGQPLMGTVKVTEIATGKVLATVSTNPVNGKFLTSIPNQGKYKVEASSNTYSTGLSDLTLSGVIPDKAKTMEIKLTKSVDPDFTLKGQYFASTKWDLLPGGMGEMNNVVSILKKYPNFKLEIVGHTDDLSTEEYNMELSEKRANAVKNYYIKQGIDPSRLVSRGMGKSQPLNDNGDDAKRALNRRVELFIIK